MTSKSTTLFRNILRVELMLILAGGGIGVVLINLGYSPGSLPFISLLFAVVTLLSVAPLVPRFQHRTFNTAEFGIWFTAYYSANIVLGGIYVVVSEYPPMNTLPYQMQLTVLSRGLFVATVGLMCFWVSYEHSLGYRIADRVRTPPRTFRRQRLPYILIGCLLIAWAARYGIVLLSSGSISAWLATPAKVRFLNLPGSTYLKYIGELSSLAGFIAASVAITDRDWRYAVVAAVILLAEMGFQLLTGTRRGIPFLLLGFVMMYYLLSERSFKRSLRFAGVGIASFIPLFVLYPFVTTYRTEGSISVMAVLANFSPLNLLGNIAHRLHGANTLSYLVYRVPEQVPHFWGRDLLLIPQSVIPRLLWSDKPMTSIDRLYTEQILPPGVYPGAQATPMMIPGHLYWTAGLGGVIIGMLVIGTLWRVLNNYLQRDRVHRPFAVLSGILFPWFFWVAEMDLVSLFTQFLFKFVLLGTVIVVASVRWSTIIYFLPISGKTAMDLQETLNMMYTNSQTYRVLQFIQEKHQAARTLWRVSWQSSKIKATIHNSYWVNLFFP